MKTLPLARTKNLVMQEIDSEVLLYNLQTNKVYCLNHTSAIVYVACDGKTRFDELIGKHQFNEELIYFSLQELQKAGLLEGEPQNYFGTLTRREIIRKVGLNTILALPIISSLVAPSAAQSQSTTCFGQTCAFDNFTQSDCCDSRFRCSDSMTPNFCQLCFSSQSRFAFAAPLADTKFCNSQPSKNLCCDEGLATGDGSWCYCP
jgi:hypothetical protein